MEEGERKTHEKERVEVGHPVPGQPLGKKALASGGEEVPEVALGQARRRKPLKTSVTLFEDLCWARFYLIHLKTIDYVFESGVI